MSSEIQFNHLWSSPILDENGDISTQLDIEKEQKLIEKLLIDSHRKITYRSAVATPEEFRIHTMNCTIAHFSMHGDNGSIGLEYPCSPYTDCIGSMYVESADGVKALGDNFNPFLVFLAACHSEAIGNAFAAIGVPHVVAIERYFLIK